MAKVCNHKLLGEYKGLLSQIVVKKKNSQYVKDQ